MRSAPITVRIAVAIFALSTAALVAMSAGVYLAFEREVRANLDGALETRAQSNLALVDGSGETISIRLPPDSGDERANGEALLRLYGADGRMLADGAPAVGVSSSEPALALRAVSERSPQFATLSYTAGESFRVVVSPVLRQGQVQGVVVTGLESAQVDDPLDILAVVLIIAVAATSLALAGGAFLIARRALRPVAMITASANRIAQGDLRDRITGIESRDEVGELASTFNRMIGRIAETVERERRFTADAAHELRTPLAALETSLDVTLARPRSAKDYRETLSAMARETRRLKGLTGQLLMLSRVDAGAVGMGFEALELGPFLEALIESFRGSHPAVTFDIAGLESAATCQGNPELLIRAFANVLENAVGHGSPQARISVLLQQEQEQAIVAIHDDGPGIPQEIVESAFQRFRRGDSSRSDSGTGLGLAIVESIVHAHGGKVRIAPTTSGTTIEFTFPISR